MRKFVLSQKSPQKDTQKTLKKTIYELTLQQNNKNYLNQQHQQLVSTTCAAINSLPRSRKLM